MRGKGALCILERRAAAVLLGLALVAISGRPAGAQPVSWKVAVFGPPRPVTASIEFLAREVAARTRGQIKIEPVYAEVLSKATEMLDGLKAQAFEAALLCASYYPGKLPVFTVEALEELAGAVGRAVVDDDEAEGLLGRAEAVQARPGEGELVVEAHDEGDALAHHASEGRARGRRRLIDRLWTTERPIERVGHWHLNSGVDLDETQQAVKNGVDIYNPAT